MVAEDVEAPGVGASQGLLDECTDAALPRVSVTSDPPLVFVRACAVLPSVIWANGLLTHILQLLRLGLHIIYVF